LLACGALGILAGCSVSATTGSVKPASTKNEMRIVKAEMGTGKNDNYEVVNPGTTFPNDTPEFMCVWTAEAPTDTDVRGVWIAEDVGKVAEPNHKIADATVKLLPSRVGEFSLSKPNNGWPVGKYRLEIYLAGTLAKSVPFTVQAK